MMKANIKKLLRDCPICSCKTGEILHEQKFVLSENSILPSSYDVVCCTECGFVFADTSATQREYNKYYSEFSKYEDNTTATGGFSRKEDITRLEKTALELSQFLKRNSNIVDIGCANGGLLFALRRLGYNNLLGIDPSRKCVQNVIAMGIEAEEGGLFSDNYDIGRQTESKFDCIILSHVLEHIRDLDIAIKNCIGLLNDGGLIYVEVPDAARYSNYYVVPYYYFDCEHINHFSKESFDNLLLRYGFKLAYKAEKELLVSENHKYPAVGLIYCKTNDKEFAHNIVRETRVRDEILSYVNLSNNDSRYGKIEKLYKSQDKIYVWGAGSYTLRLLSDTNLKYCNIIYFIDNDSNKRGIKLKDCYVKSPNDITDSDCTIVICSALHSNEIVEQIHQLKLKNDIIII